MSETIWMSFAIPGVTIVVGVILGLLLAAIFRANDK